MRQHSVDDLPLISERENGDRVVGYRMPQATADLYAAGTPPVWQLAKRPPLSVRVGSVRVGDRLNVAQVARHWVVSDDEGTLGWLTWQAAMNGQPHAVTGRPIRLPPTGTLHVRTLLVDPQGDIKNFGGYVDPHPTPEVNRAWCEHSVADECVGCGWSTTMGSVLDKGVVMRQPTLFLLVGLPATGKTTAARRLEMDHHALRLTKDEWMKALYGEQNPSSASDVIEGRLIEIGLRALELGLNVVIDFGLWGRDERSALRQAATDCGAGVEMYYFEVSADEQRRRLDQRLTVEPHTTWHISEEELVGWADKIQVPTPGEVDGSEAIDVPPPGFTSWDEWRWDRWPPSIA